MTVKELKKALENQDDKTTIQVFSNDNDEYFDIDKISLDLQANLICLHIEE